MLIIGEEKSETITREKFFSAEWIIKAQSSSIEMHNHAVLSQSQHLKKN
jgi:hypothetical protein